MSAEIRFDLNIVSLDAIKKAIYRYGDRITFSLSLEGGSVSCKLEPRSSVSSEVNLNAILEQLPLDVVDQDLRERLFKQTELVRNTILALAFSRTGLQG